MSAIADAIAKASVAELEEFAREIEAALPRVNLSCPLILGGGCEGEAREHSVVAFEGALKQAARRLRT